MPDEPKTREDWQLAVDAADAALSLNAARQYGLVKGGPGVNVDRCVEILNQGRRRGIIPSPDSIERFVAGLQAEQANTGSGRRTRGGKDA
jgi:hypothetical protein